MADASETTSFIPKNANKVRRPRVNKRIYIFSYISYVFFFGTLLTVVGVYVYSLQVQKGVAAQQEQLAEARETFSESDIEEVRELEKRLLLAERILNESSAPSKIFAAVESVIAESVYLSQFEYVREDDNSFTLTFEGAIDSFESAMFQRDLFHTLPVLASAEVTDFSYGETEEEGGSAEGTTGEALTVTFESVAHTSLFPYEAPTVEEEALSATASTSDAISDNEASL